MAVRQSQKPILRLYLSGNLRRLRKDKGATKSDVQQATGISEHTYEKWEAGLNFPTDENLRKLAVYFQVPVDSLSKKPKDLTYYF